MRDVLITIIHVIIHSCVHINHIQKHTHSQTHTHTQQYKGLSAEENTIAVIWRSPLDRSAAGDTHLTHNGCMKYRNNICLSFSLLRVFHIRRETKFWEHIENVPKKKKKRFWTQYQYSANNTQYLQYVYLSIYVFALQFNWTVSIK